MPVRPRSGRHLRSTEAGGGLGDRRHGRQPRIGGLTQRFQMGTVREKQLGVTPRNRQVNAPARCCTADDGCRHAHHRGPARAAPAFLRMDDGPEMIAWTLRDYCRMTGFATRYIEPRQPRRPNPRRLRRQLGRTSTTATLRNGGPLTGVPSQHPGRDLGGCHAVDEGVGTQADQGLRSRHVQLGHDKTGRLIHLNPGLSVSRWSRSIWSWSR